DGGPMPLEATTFLAGSNVPQAYRIVMAAREDVAAIRREGNTGNAIFVASKAPEFACFGKAPEAHDRVFAARDGPAAVRRKGSAPDFIRMAAQAAKLSVC